MKKLIKDEIKKFKPFMAQLQFEGVSLDRMLDILTKHLIIKIKQEQEAVK